MKPSRKTLSSKQRTVTAADKAYWGKLAEIGCIACRIDDVKNGHVSIHHIDGRTKPGCHTRVLPLCAPHHQHDDGDPAKRVGIHPNKAQFEARYGTQMELKEMCDNLIGEQK